MSATKQVLHCKGGDHEWERPTAAGRRPGYCPEHPAPPPPSHAPDVRAAYMRRYTHDGSDVSAAEVVEWVRSLGLEVERSLRGRTADILVARYNREHPDRPYARVTR